MATSATAANSTTTTPKPKPSRVPIFKLEMFMIVSIGDQLALQYFDVDPMAAAHIA
jgi:hypothetical protein